MKVYNDEASQGMMDAARRGLSVDDFLKQNADPNYVDPQTGETALGLASTAGTMNANSIETLVAAGADPFQPNGSGETPFKKVTDVLANAANNAALNELQKRHANIPEVDKYLNRAIPIMIKNAGVDVDYARAALSAMVTGREKYLAAQAAKGEKSPAAEADVSGDTLKPVGDSWRDAVGSQAVGGFASKETAGATSIASVVADHHQPRTR